MSPFFAELIGTMVLILMGNGVVAGSVLKDTKSNNGGWIVITLGWGIAVALGIYAVGHISGAHINPAVTIALATSGEFPWADVPAYILGQFLGAMLGATLVWIHYLPHWKESEQDLIRASFCNTPALRFTFVNLVSEIIGTFVLVCAILFIGANNFTEGLNPLVIGALIVAIGMSLGGTTGYAINPARDLGPRIMHFLLPIGGKGGSDWSYSWIPVIGPILGGILGSLFYNAVFKQSISIGFIIISLICGSIVVIAIINQIKRDREV